MTVDLASLLLQSGLIGVFVIYALVRDKREAGERTARATEAATERAGRDSEWRKFLADQSEMFRKDAAERDTYWRALLEDQRQQRVEAMSTGTNYIQDLTAAVGKVAEGLASHDLAAQDRHEALAKAISDVHATILGNRQLIKKAVR